MDQNKKNLVNMNAHANKVTGTLEKRHREEMENVTGKMKTTKQKLAAAIKEETDTTKTNKRLRKERDETKGELETLKARAEDERKRLARSLVP